MDSGGKEVQLREATDASNDTINFADLQVMDYENPKEYTIADVTVSGIEFIQKEVLISLSGLKAGNTITLPGDAVTDVLKKFWSQGLFADARITATEIRNDSVWLDIYLTEQSRMSRLTINGIGKSETQDVMEKINLRNGQQVTADIMNNTKRIIREHFIEKGFRNTEVNIHLKEDTIRVNMVQMEVNVDKKDKVKINEIYFTGVNSFKEVQLRRKMKDTKKVNINIFKASKLISETFKQDKVKLIEFYNENGYRDAKVLSDSVAISPDMKNRLDLYINMEEGNMYHVGDIEWIGNTKYPAEFLSAVLGIEKGDVFDQKVLDERLFIDEDAVNGVYLDNGYLFFQLTPVEVSVEDDTIDFEMRIYEGEIATINNVIIKGNNRTSEHVVRRELRTLPGDKFSKSELGHRPTGGFRWIRSRDAGGYHRDPVLQLCHRAHPGSQGMASGAFGKWTDPLSEGADQREVLPILQLLVRGTVVRGEETQLLLHLGLPLQDQPELLQLLEPG